MNRWWGKEILDHDPAAVDLTRLNEIGCVLFNHDRDKVVGKVLRAWIEAGRGLAEIEFDSDPDSDTIFQKVRTGTLKGVSVGYQIGLTEEVKPGQTSADGRFTGPCEIARKWWPLEVSIVSVPADETVGVGRQETAAETPEGNPEPLQYIKQEVTQMNDTQRAANAEPEIVKDEIRAAEAATPVAVPETNADAVRQAVEAERARINEITGICRSFDMDAAQYISGGQSVDQVRQAVLDALMHKNRPVSTGVHVTETGEDNFRRDAVDGLLLRTGVDGAVESPSTGAQKFRNLSLRDLAIQCLSREGNRSMNDLLTTHPDDLYNELCRQFYNPSAAFPAIMDETIRKGIVRLYNNVPTTFQLFTSKGTLKDFKQTADHEYVIGGVGDWALVPENGEIKPDLPRTELLPQRKLDTYAKSFSMSRQAFINDDIGFLTEVPGLYATAAKKTIDKQVYQILVGNTAIFDGQKLFCEEHKNLLSTGEKPSLEALQNMILAMQQQTDHFGEPIYINPRFIILPVGYEFDIYKVLHSTQVTGSNNNDVNPLYNYPIQVIQSPVINALAGEAAAPWFMVGDGARGIQVDYLNGQETPTVRRMEAPGTLGFMWDMYLDWGIAVRDFRAIARNDGAVIAPVLKKK